jgi:hypothetical protein
MNHKANVRAINIINIVNLHNPDIVLIKLNISFHASNISDNNVVRNVRFDRLAARK